ncbi:MAG: saccharopine dehydrogenase, partial [Rhodobacterales bacterium CG15_BIG_FIL_POST_REV_8_21_14_020_59_13]
MTQRQYGIVVYGASGFTGRLVAEYLNTAYGDAPELSWAMAGRSVSKLEAVREEMGISGNVDILAADASDPASLKVMAESASVIITTV